MSYDRTTTRLAEKNCREHRLFVKPVPATPPSATGATGVAGRSTGREVA